MTRLFNLFHSFGVQLKRKTLHYHHDVEIYPQFLPIAVLTSMNFCLFQGLIDIFIFMLAICVNLPLICVGLPDTNSHNLTLRLVPTHSGTGILVSES
jgi:hypothetical protein